MRRWIAEDMGQASIDSQNRGKQSKYPSNMGQMDRGSSKKLQAGRRRSSRRAAVGLQTIGNRTSGAGFAPRGRRIHPWQEPGREKTKVSSSSLAQNRLHGRSFAFLPALLAAVFVTGCIGYKPAPDSYQPHLDRVITRENGPIRASVAMLSRKEAEEMFDLPLHKKGIQPVWVRLENSSPSLFYFLPASLDANYYSPAEVAHLFGKFLRSKRNRKVTNFMEQKHIGLEVPPESTVEGFVFSAYDPGAKHVLIDLIGEYEHWRLEFSIPVPGYRLDQERVDLDNLYSPENRKDYTLEDLPDVLRTLPSATTDKKGKGSGDPLNLVVVEGKSDDVQMAFLRQGWDVTEVLTFGGTFRLISAFLFHSTWRTSPVSSLFLYGRRQDFALQKARSTIHQRNHLRLWLAPFTCEGRDVFIGQISRDIGLRFSFRAPGFVTHKIDPDVDEARNYLTQEMIISGSVERVAWIEGVGEASRDQPRRNLTRDPYYTKGYRVVLFLSDHPTPPDEVHLNDWRKNPEPPE
jgi:hypothetical protein